MARKMNFNSVSLVGTVAKDPDMTDRRDGVRIADFNLEVTRRWKDRNTEEQCEDVLCIPIRAWGNVAALIENHVNAGDQVLVDGKLHNEGRNGGGTKQDSIYVAARYVQWQSNGRNPYEQGNS